MPDPFAADPTRRLKRPLQITLAAMLAERAAQAFWPFVTTAMLAAALLLSGALAFWADWIGQGLLAALAIGALATFVLGVRRFEPATRGDALARLDASLEGYPISALADRQAIGADDPASVDLWHAHRQRMSARLAAARPLPPAPGLARRDPFALRLTAATALAAAILFGAGTQRGDLAALLPGGAAAAIPQASWEGWIEPPAYTGKPTLYLSAQSSGALTVPLGSRATLRLYGSADATKVSETFTGTDSGDAGPTRTFAITRDGRLSVGAESWEITVVPDLPPHVAAAGELTRTLAGEMRLPFRAGDDYGVTAGRAAITLDLGHIDRRYGLAAVPDKRAPVVVDLPMPYRGDRREIDEMLVENLARHPWAGLPVSVSFRVTDAAGQSGESAPVEIVLPGRRFLDPLAAAIVEQRRDILWTVANAGRAARLLRAISNRPEGGLSDSGQYLALRAAVGDLEAPGLTPTARDAVAETLWNIAVKIEDGALADALSRLRRAQERLSEAMRQGATEKELRELMDQYRQAMRDYLRQLGREQPKNRTDQPDKGGQSLQMTQADLQAMMDKIQELMDAGRMQEAQQMLDQLQQMMENMEVTDGASGQQGEPQGQQSMNDLADTLRRQQGLSDQAFRDLQEQRNPAAGAGESAQNSGRDGGQGQGQSHDGAGSKGTGEGAGDGSESSDPGSGSGRDLAARQRELEQDLARQRDRLPGTGTAEGDAARRALDDAGKAMGRAADALERGDTPGALDQQAEAMENLRQGMRNLRDAMQRQTQTGRQGRLAGEPGTRRGADPLGRDQSASGATANDSPFADRQDIYRRAQELTDELRRRSGETDRPTAERDYLKRLLEQF